MSDKIDRLAHVAEEAEKLSEDIREEVKQQKQSAKELIIENVDLDNLEEQYISSFAEKPYKIIPKDKEEAWVVTPRFIPFNVGWLHSQDEAWNVFVVNKYVDWINELPDDIKDKVGINPEYEKAEVDGKIVEFDNKDDRDRAWEDLGGRDGGLHARKDDNKIKIKKGNEFEVIAKLIDQGNLPFKSKPVPESDIRTEPEDIQLRTYQERAWEKFKETGMVGVYWAPGAGKTFLTLYAGDRIKGKKLIIVPSSTLEEQWEKRIKKFCRHPEEWEVRTYQYITYSKKRLEKYQDMDIKLTVFDECHHLPANSFSKLATIDTDYRLGLSASPYREDGRTEYIFALTGVPVGLKWRELIELGAVKEPDVYVYQYSTSNRKRKDLKNVVDEETGKILIFCDRIKEGKKISNILGVPFVHGQTNNRMEKFKDNRVVISSRVGDEGLSLDNLDVVIEYGFHGASRRQEAQRAGRTMHGEGDGRHIIMMTDEELQKHEKRLYALEEQGFKPKFTRRK